MCLITEQKIAKILKEDLTVYKTLQIVRGNNLKSMKHEFYWDIGRLYKQPLKVDNIPDTMADKIVDDHYFKDGGFCTAARYLTNVHDGFHFYCSKERMGKSCWHGWGEIVRVECTVPKGSRVYFDETGLGVANQIIINKIITN